MASTKRCEKSAALRSRSVSADEEARNGLGIGFLICIESKFAFHSRRRWPIFPRKEFTFHLAKAIRGGGGLSDLLPSNYNVDTF